MMRNRVIPILLHSVDGLIKTTRFKDPIYIGDPLNAVRIFNNKFVDELVLLDIDRSRNGLEPNFSLASRIASECFMPLGFGGGIRNISDAKVLLSCGVEKLILQTSALNSGELIYQIASFSGSQSVSVSLDIFKDRAGQYFVYHAATRKLLNFSLQELVKQLESQGAGELIITSVNNEGSMRGYDLDLIKLVRDVTNVPLVAHGGAGKTDDFKKALVAGADAVAAGSLFVFYSPRKGVLINYPRYEELHELVGIGNE